MTSRSTWAVFPYTILSLCWVSLLTRAQRILAAWKDSQRHRLRSGKVIDFEDDDDFDELMTAEDETEGMTARQKVTIGFIWIFAMAYSFMSEQVSNSL